MDNIEKIKLLWPELQVTNEIYHKPTRDFVIKLYNHFITAVEERIIFILGGWDVDNTRRDLDLEDVTYLMMRKFNIVFQQFNMDFMPGDIYDPSPKRTNSFIKICIHIINFFEIGISTYLEKFTGEILEKKKEAVKLAGKKEQLLVQINEAVLTKVKLLKECDHLKMKIKNVEEEKEDYLVKVSNVERTFQEQRKELESLQKKVEDKKIAVEKLKAKENRLLEESVTKEEYMALKESISDLEIENESLEIDDINIEEILSHEHEILEHLRECMKAEPDAFNVNLVDKYTSKKIELEDLETEKNHLLSKLSTQKHALVKQKKIFKDFKNTFIKSDLENKNVRNSVKQKSELLSKDVLKKKEELQINLKKALVENQRLMTEKTNFEKQLETLRKHFYKEYIKIARKENEIFKNFKTQFEYFGKKTE